MAFIFSKREQWIIWVLGILAAGYVIYTAVDHLFWQRMTLLRRQAQEARQQLAVQTRRQELLSARLAGQGDLLERFRQTESDGSVRARMQADLQELSSREQVRIADIKPVTEKNEGFYKEFPVSVTLEGAFVDIMRFLYFAQTPRFDFRIREFRFSRAYSEGAALQCQVVLVKMFWTSSE